MGKRYPLRRIGLADVMKRQASFDDPDTLSVARSIMEGVRTGGQAALLEYARALDGSDGRLWYGPEDFSAALNGLPSAKRGLLERTRDRIRDFSVAQRDSLAALDLALRGGRSGHELVPVERAGCYAPGGLYPLPSSVLMTAIPASVAGVPDIALACPRPTQLVLAACALGGVGLCLAAGGAQAIAAFCYGAGPLAPRDLVVGPGNRYVAAAKLLAHAQLRTDAPAGPSELLILADHTADPVALAWDLLAQAEHDPDARSCLAASSEGVAAGVEEALYEALLELEKTAPANARTARAALDGSWLYVPGPKVACSSDVPDPLTGLSPAEAALVEAANRFCPEHLELALDRPDRLVPLIRNAGALFVGSASAEALGDYGAGPNHTLPTGGRSRSSGGLSVFDFLRVRTWLRMDEGAGLKALARDAANFARLEGLEAHARSAERRLEP